MINFIENSDFVGNLEKIFFGDKVTTEYSNNIITKYQKDILISILGEIEYYNLDQDISTVDGVTYPQSTKWINFVDGVDYTEDSIHYDYKGIKPMLIKMMYYYWQVETASLLAQSGELVNNNKNSIKVIPINKMVNSYNDGIDLIKSCRTYAPTIYKYLYDEGSFTDWSYTQIEKINTFNL